MDLTSCAIQLVPRILEGAFTVIAIASAIAALTPTPRDDEFVSRIYRIIDALALNLGHAKEQAKSTGGRFVAE
ncbi:MAG: hypothetical protein WD969_14340 [Paracoccaceae bacterium]